LQELIQSIIFSDIPIAERDSLKVFKRNFNVINHTNYFEIIFDLFSNEGVTKNWHNKNSVLYDILTKGISFILKTILIV
jgi:hypothetical protein